MIHLCKCLEHKHGLQDREMWQWITDNFEFHNDSYLSLEGCELNQNDYDKIEDYIFEESFGKAYLKMINDVFPIDKHLFLVSW